MSTAYCTECARTWWTTLWWPGQRLSTAFWLTVPFYLTASVGLMAAVGPETLPRPTQPVCLGASAGVTCLVPPTASLVPHVLQHTAAAAGLHVQCRVSCQLAAGLVPCGLAQLAAAPLGAAAEALQSLVPFACY